MALHGGRQSLPHPQHSERVPGRGECSVKFTSKPRGHSMLGVWGAWTNCTVPALESVSRGRTDPSSPEKPSQLGPRAESPECPRARRQSLPRSSEDEAHSLPCFCALVCARGSTDAVCVGTFVMAQSENQRAKAEKWINEMGYPQVRVFQIMLENAWIWKKITN